jgi:hypothetical protein
MLSVAFRELQSDDPFQRKSPTEAGWRGGRSPLILFSVQVCLCVRFDITSSGRSLVRASRRARYPTRLVGELREVRRRWRRRGPPIGIMISVQFIGEFSDSRKREVSDLLERHYGSARCDVHGAALRFVVTRFDRAPRGFTFRWTACCDAFDLTMSLERDREIEIEFWQEQYRAETPDDKLTA